MCFSATASFTAAAICGGIGAAALRQANGRDLMLAFIPVIFGAHQALEGAVWLTAGEGLGRCAGYSFASVAFCLWPVYIPWAARRSECNARRRTLMLPFLVLGVVVAVAAASVLHSGLKIDFAAHHIKYLPGRRYPLIFDYLYAAAVVGPILLHRSMYVKGFGCLIAAFFAVSLLVFNPARYSVWCFFAAASSIVLYFFAVSRNSRERGQSSQAPARPQT
ncbi:MAG: DUF6629 family protein [Rhodomicrobium sp.]